MGRLLFERHAWDGWRRTMIVTDSSPEDPADAEVTPPLDVIETPHAYEVIVDLPGLTADTIDVRVHDHTLVISGHKPSFACRTRGAAFHIAERGAGRFVRTVHFAGACDGSRVTATLSNGELHVVIPRVEERRGALRTITVTAD